MGDVVGGSGFIVRVAGEPAPLFLTAHQRFTSAAGLDRDYEGAELVTLEALGLRFDRHEFLDHSHLDLRGAQRFTEALAENVIVPALAR